VGGQGKYNRLTGSLRIGFNGIIAFSDSLLSLMVVAGLSMSILALLAIPWWHTSRPRALHVCPGLAPRASSCCFWRGSAHEHGVLGAYIGRIYDEAKRRQVHRRGIARLSESVSRLNQAGPQDGRDF